LPFALIAMSRLVLPAGWVVKIVPGRAINVALAAIENPERVDEPVFDV